MWMPTNIDIHLNFLRTRRTVRRFKPDLIPEETVNRILEIAHFAPSAHDLHPWRFVNLKTTESRAKLGKALIDAMKADMLLESVDETEIEKRRANSVRRLDEAPIIILLCSDSSAVRENKLEEQIMSIQSVSNAGLYLLLAAHAEGLGGNWICWPLYAQDETRRSLNLPTEWNPQAMFFLGLPAEIPARKPTKIQNIVVDR